MLNCCLCLNISYGHPITYGAVMIELIRLAGVLVYNSLRRERRTRPQLQLPLSNPCAAKSAYSMKYVPTKTGNQITIGRAVPGGRNYKVYSQGGAMPFYSSPLRYLKPDINTPEATSGNRILIGTPRASRKQGALSSRNRTCIR